MKRSYLFLTLLLSAFLFSACGGGASDATADTPVDFSMSVAEFDKLTSADKEKYEGKIVELTGTVKNAKKASELDAENGSHFVYLEGVAEGGFPPAVTCFFSSDQAAHKGKTAAIKGTVKFYDIADGAFLTGSYLTAK